MTSRLPHICVCICTYRRPELLHRLLSELTKQKTAGAFTYSISVADNDVSESAKVIVEAMALTSSLEIAYSVEPRRNIALVRNKALQHSRGDFIAFIDDDEYPGEDWLLQLFNLCVNQNVDGVLGPVVPAYNEEPPAWVKKGRFHDRPRHQTGFLIDQTEGRTGNLLFKRSLLDGNPSVFRPEFGSGGEDRDVFRRWIGAGRKFAWCDEAVAYEDVPAVRWKRSFLIRRALLRGKMCLADSENRLANLVRSFIAVPAYIVVLPVLWLFGQHVFMRCLISLFDHLGRIIAWLGFEPVKDIYITE